MSKQIEAMKRFLIETSVENAEGSQTWYVDATSEAEALEKYKEGGCDLYASEVDVTSLGEPEISGETTLDDFGDFAEQPAQQEPVACIGSLNEFRAMELVNRGFSLTDPLYTTPQAQPLTDDKYEAIVEDIADWSRYVEVDTAHQSLEKHVREVLTAHGITKGNT